MFTEGIFQEIPISDAAWLRTTGYIVYSIVQQWAAAMTLKEPQFRPAFWILVPRVGFCALDQFDRRLPIPEEPSSIKSWYTEPPPIPSEKCG
ncbi:hypothetical protein AG1IA_07909 [Rhizoctonia solani AG-1 IA]|uniref:Uncharacterized protein n=1 Tax=Thanatephorus cucumeris (strain AG1-IA) TaxID=983506 RepID=L8WMR1_THACA|nr:hypothetical protein AG1IA_07909 [Rhizoctonia solani AG-1 IA]